MAIPDDIAALATHPLAECGAGLMLQCDDGELAVMRDMFKVVSPFFGQLLTSTEERVVKPAVPTGSAAGADTRAVEEGTARGSQGKARLVTPGRCIPRQWQGGQGRSRRFAMMDIHHSWQGIWRSNTGTGPDWQPGLPTVTQIDTPASHNVSTHVLHTRIYIPATYQLHTRIAQSRLAAGSRPACVTSPLTP
ncbi:hypothetical protein HaLaN_16739 [Haematococcus lacustris]|uniref:BTB domain-containing protein n=1 Tax=Haematococcus lacustris TaxID=44745 RepID=A0A699ZLD3_HAELA|nr:hypothetical protein HaLaN_16739 [Haematococcus lacustris]